MQFINIVVHSVDDMNYRVALQWEFASLGLEEYLEKLRPNESEELSVQISGKTSLKIYLAFNVSKFVKGYLNSCPIRIFTEPFVLVQLLAVSL